jgi:putative transposase
MEKELGGSPPSEKRRVFMLARKSLFLFGMPQTRQSFVDCVRIVPKKTHYVVEVVYTVQPQKAKVNPSLFASIDIGLNNLVTVTSNKQGFMPLVVNGKPLKSINQYFNKKTAHLQSCLSSSAFETCLLRAERKTSNQIEKLTDKRNFKINHELHVASSPLAM